MSKIKEKIQEGHILFRAIVEVAGKPKEHIEKTMEVMINRIKEEEEDLILTKGQAFKTKEVEIKGQKMFTSYAELEMLAKEVSRISGFCFDYMPSSIEILEPSDLKVTVRDFTETLNDLLTKLHNMDMALKNLRAENKILNENASALIRNLFIHTLSKEPKTLQKISKLMGIPEDKLEPLLEQGIEQKFIEKSGDKYKLAK